jgi:hypothetical protein
VESSHNSVTLSWQPPRHNAGCTVYAYTVELATPRDPKAWSVLTRSCQTSRYTAKGLQTAGEYIFRVRAENIYGLSKPSRPSDVIVTNMYESVSETIYGSGMTSSATFPSASSSAGGYDNGNDVDGNLRVRNAPHRRSINLHLEGTVTAILNHTDVEVKATTPGGHEIKVTSPTGEVRCIGALNNSQESIGLVRGSGERATALSTSSRYSSLQRDGTLQRDSAVRSSLPMGGRKRSLPILLPGTRTNSLLKLRDSQTIPNLKAKGEMSNSSSMDSLKRRMGSVSLAGEGGQEGQRLSVRRSRTGSDICSNYSSGSSGSKEDVTDCKSVCSCSCSFTANGKDSVMESSATDSLKKQSKEQHEKEEGLGSTNTLNSKCDKCGGSKGSKRNSACSERGGGGRSSDYCTTSCSESQRNSQATDDSDPLSEDSGNPWERHEDSSDVIMSAPVCDDVKLALYTQRGVPDGHTTWATSKSVLESEDYSDSGHHVGHQADLRSLRSLLHSDDIIVKPTRSLPDMNGGGGGGLNKANRNSLNNNNNNNNKLTTILDLEEEEDSVRVTTL